MSRRIASPAGGAGRAHYIVSPVSPGAFESLSHRSVHGCRQFAVFGSCELVKCAQAACCRVACSAGSFPMSAPAVAQLLGAIARGLRS